MGPSETPALTDTDPDLAAEVAAEQFLPNTLIGDEFFRRIRFGEDLPASPGACPGCSVRHGMVHVFGCPVERCAKSGRQWMSRTSPAGCGREGGCACQGDEGFWFGDRLPEGAIGADE